MREHILVAERALGKPLPPRAVVHHANEDRASNGNRNLVICEDQRYHMLLHARTATVRAGGNPKVEKWCPHCERLKPLTRFRPEPKRADGWHCVCRDCLAEKQQRHREQEISA